METARIRHFSPLSSLSLLLAACLLPGVAAAFSSGSGACEATAEAASPMGAVAIGSGGYALEVDAGLGIPSNQYPPGGSAELRVTGDVSFKGLLVYAEDAQGNRVGGFITFDPTIYRLLAGCSGDTDGTLTHAGSSPKVPPQAFQWRAPNSDVGPLIFRAIVLRGFNDFYVIASPPIAAAESALFVDGFESVP